MYCSDCVFYQVEDVDGESTPYCLAHANITQPILDANEKNECPYHLTIPVAKLQASVRNAVFTTLGDPVKAAESLKKAISSDDMKACIDENLSSK